jgi:hypothetical protein
VRVQLPSGAIANVSRDVKPETLAALDEMMKLAAKQFAQRNQDKESVRGSAGRLDQPLSNRAAGRAS